MIYLGLRRAPVASLPKITGIDSPRQSSTILRGGYFANGSGVPCSKQKRLVLKPLLPTALILEQRRFPDLRRQPAPVAVVGRAESGLPAPRRSQAGLRPEEVVEITVIAELRRKGFSLQKIRRVLRFLQREMGRRLSDVLAPSPNSTW